MLDGGGEDGRPEASGVTELGDGDADARLVGAVAARDRLGEVGEARRVGTRERLPAFVGPAHAQHEEAAEAGHFGQGGGDGPGRGAGGVGQAYGTRSGHDGVRRRGGVMV